MIRHIVAVTMLASLALFGPVAAASADSRIPTDDPIADLLKTLNGGTGTDALTGLLNSGGVNGAGGALAGVAGGLAG